MTLKLALTLICLHLICAGCCLGAPSPVVELFPEYEARINWSVGVVKAVGRAAVPGDIEDPDQARQIAREQAVIAARRNLLSALSLLRVTDTSAVNDRMLSSDAIRSAVETLARNAGIISSRQIYDRSYEVIVQTGIYGKGGLAAALFGILVEEMPIFIIEIKADGFRPSMIPDILDEQQRPIFPQISDDGDAVQPAMRVYYGNAKPDAGDGKQSLLRVKAVGITPTGGIILGKRDSARLRAFLGEHND